MSLQKWEERVGKTREAYLACLRVCEKEPVRLLKSIEKHKTNPDWVVDEIWAGASKEIRSNGSELGGELIIRFRNRIVRLCGYFADRDKMDKESLVLALEHARRFETIDLLLVAGLSNEPMTKWAPSGSDCDAAIADFNKAMARYDAAYWAYENCKLSVIVTGSPTSWSGYPPIFPEGNPNDPNSPGQLCSYKAMVMNAELNSVNTAINQVKNMCGGWLGSFLP